LQFLHFAFPVPARVPEDGDRRPFASLRGSVSGSMSSLSPAGFGYPSSGAVYGNARSDAVNVYGAEKSADEIAFREHTDAAGTRIVIPRVFAVGGPWSPDPRRYLLGDLVQQVLGDDTLRLRSANPVYRSFVSIADVLALMLLELLSANTEELVFDACGAEVVEAFALAERVRDVLGRPDVLILRGSDDGDAGDDSYVGDPTAFAALAAAWDHEVAPLDEIIRQTALG
jgi:nucleoside-diphosphate-sugar epimerase